MKDHRLLAGAVVAVLAIWLVGAAVTKYSLEQMAFFAPIAVCVLGATVAVVMLWVKVITQLRRERRERREASSRSGIPQERNPAA
jgi:undecaprenyl pyrophosphate phosphatase UppP